MKKYCKPLALLLAIFMMVSVISACGGNDNGASSSGQTVSDAQDASGAPAESMEDSEPGDTGVNAADREPYTVKIMMFDEGKTEIVNEIADAASAITEEKFNTKVELVRVDWGSWAQQVTLALTSGEKLDLFPAFALNTSLTTLVTNGQLLPMTDLLQNGAGSTMYGMVPEEDWRCTTIDGEIYGVPMNRGKQNVYGAACDLTIAEELNIDLDAVSTLDDFEEVLAKVKEAYPDMYPMASNNQSMRIMIPSDTLGDPRDVVLGCLVNALDGGTTVENLYASDDYRAFTERMYDWAQKGYIMPDAASNTEGGIALIRAGAAFADFYTGPAPDTEARISVEAGKPMKDVEFFEHYKTTAETSPCWSIAANSEQPDRAMEVLNEMYTNQELANLFIYGIEGKTYEFVNEERTVIDYPEGVDAGNSGYAFDHWGWPNMLQSYVWNGYPENVYEEYVTFNEGGVISPAYGFSFDNAPVINEYTACTNVVLKYVEALNCGSMNPAENLDKFNQELKDNGIDTIVAEKQKQLDAWLAEQ